MLGWLIAIALVAWALFGRGLGTSTLLTPGPTLPPSQPTGGNPTEQPSFFSQNTVSPIVSYGGAPTVSSPVAAGAAASSSGSGSGSGSGGSGATITSTQGSDTTSGSTSGAGGGTSGPGRVFNVD